MLPELLKTKIINHLIDQTSASNWSVTYPGIRSTDCTVYRLSSSDYTKEYALKVYHPDKGSKLALQYSTNIRFADLLNTTNAQYRVPELAGLFSDDDCFLMEWVTGKDLDTLLWKNFWHKGKMQKHINDAYQWMNHYHKHANLNLKQVDIMRYASIIESHSKQLDLQEFCNNNPIFKAGFETLNAVAHQFNDYETLHADIHGDLNLSNIILADSHVTGIDIGATENAPIEDDMTLLLIYICAEYFNMLTRFDMRKPLETWEIFNVALDAYQYPRDKKARQFFLFVFLFQTLRRWMAWYYFHNKSSDDMSKNESRPAYIVMLEKWRLRNCAIIVKELTKVMDEQLMPS